MFIAGFDDKKNEALNGKVHLNRVECIGWQK